MTDTQYGTANDDEQERKVRRFFNIFAELRALQAECDRIVGYSTPEGEVICRACAEQRAAVEGLDLDAECAAYAERRRLIEGYLLFGAGGVMEEHPGTAQGDDRSIGGWETIRQYEADADACENIGDEDDVRAVEAWDYPLCDVCSNSFGDTL